MKIKLPFTEKFLLDLYKFINKTGKITKEIFDATIPKCTGHNARAASKMFHVFRDVWENRYYEKKKKDKDYFYKLVYQLKQRGFLKTLRIKDESAIMITPKGVEKIFAAKMKISNREVRKDGKWQMVLFDIPENKRRDRDYFRNGLQYLGYKMLQKSIWVCQYDTLKETKELIERYNLKSLVELLLVNKISLR